MARYAMPGIAIGQGYTCFPYGAMPRRACGMTMRRASRTGTRRGSCPSLLSYALLGTDIISYAMPGTGLGPTRCPVLTCCATQCPVLT
eukprot:1384844-Rhodomonas_salina.4